MTAPQTGTHHADPAPARTAWAAVSMLMATSFAIVLSEFLPPSLLPQMGAALGVSEGQAGQTVAATAIAGFVAGPSAAILVPRLDRRTTIEARV